MTLFRSILSPLIQLVDKRFAKEDKCDDQTIPNPPQQSRTTALTSPARKCPVDLRTFKGEGRRRHARLCVAVAARQPFLKMSPEQLPPPRCLGCQSSDRTALFCLLRCGSFFCFLFCFQMGVPLEGRRRVQKAHSRQCATGEHILCQQRLLSLLSLSLSSSSCSFLIPCSSLACLFLCSCIYVCMSFSQYLSFCRFLSVIRSCLPLIAPLDFLTTTP